MKEQAPRCTATTQKGKPCANPAYREGLCKMHFTSVEHAEVVELPKFTNRGAETIEKIEIYDAANPDAGVTTFVLDEEDEPKQQVAKPPGFANRHPKQRCRERSCFKVRGHEGRHENGSASVATCAAKDCRLTLGHSGPHGQGVKVRTRIGELTGKL